MPAIKCAICGRSISKKTSYLKDEDSDSFFHKKCFRKEYGSFRNLAANPVGSGGGAEAFGEAASKIVIQLGKFVQSPEGRGVIKRVIKTAAGEPLKALMVAAEKKGVIPEGSAVKQAEAVNTIISSVLREEATGQRANISAAVVMAALSIVGALMSTKGGRTLIKAIYPGYWAGLAARKGYQFAGKKLEARGGKLATVGRGLTAVGGVYQKVDEVSDKGMEMAGKVMTLKFNPSQEIAKIGYRKVGKTPGSTTFYLRVVLKDGTNLPSVAAFQHRQISATEADIDEGYKAFAGKSFGALVAYLRQHPDKYLLDGEVVDAYENPEKRAFSPQLLGPVTELISAWDKKDRMGMFQAEEKIYRITGMRKVIPFSLTAEERHDPWLLARRISCIAQLKEKGDDTYNPFAVCRSKVRANPGDQKVDVLTRLYNEGKDFTRYFNGTVGNLEILGYWEETGHLGEFHPLTADKAAMVVAELARGGFETKVETWQATDMYRGGHYDATSIEILNTATLPFTPIENPVCGISNSPMTVCSNPTPDDWKEAIAGEGWAIGDYTAMLDGATPGEAVVLEHIIAEEKEHLDELMALRGCVANENPRGLTSRVFGNLVAIYHVPGVLGPMRAIHIPPVEGFIGGWKHGNANYILRRGPRGAWRWEHQSGDGRTIRLAEDNAVDYSWQTDPRVLEAIHKTQNTFQKHFDTSDEAHEWADQNKVEILDIFYDFDTGQYALNYRGFPVEQEKYDEPVENPTGVLPVTSALKKAMGY